MISDRVRVRFAPSPTGMPHIGSLRTALFNYLFARHNNGKFLLRIEDTDKQRSEKRYTDAIIDMLSWCSMLPDEPPVVQSTRHAEHIRVAQQLIADGKAYKCYCTPEQLEARLKKVTTQGVSYMRYDGFCKKFIGHDKQEPYVIRFRVPENCTQVVVEDAIKGPITFGTDTFDDFILVRSDSAPMYNFVVVIDDAFMRITHVIRGEEHLINTPKQILLYQACGYTVPTFAHLPLILGPDGTKLSKRDAAANAHDYMPRGYLAQALCNYLVRLGWAHGDQEIFTFAQMIEAFTLEAVSSKGALFDQQKLDWVNSQHMKTYAADTLYDYMVSTMQLPLVTKLHHFSLQTVYGLIDLYKQRCVTLLDLYHALCALHERPTSFEGDALTHEQKNIIDSVVTVLNVTDFEHDTLKHRFKTFCKTQELTLGDIAPLIRVALTGKKDAPGIYDLMIALGKTETLERLNGIIKQ